MDADDYEPYGPRFERMWQYLFPRAMESTPSHPSKGDQRISLEELYKAGYWFDAVVDAVSSVSDAGYALPDWVLDDAEVFGWPSSEEYRDRVFAEARQLAATAKAEGIDPI